MVKYASSLTKRTAANISGGIYRDAALASPFLGSGTNSTEASLTNKRIDSATVASGSSSVVG
jgi:hypothetical protein